MSFQVYMNEKINCKETRDIPEDLIIRLVGKICMVSVSYLHQTFGLELSLNGEGIYTTSVNEATLDEAPMAYKSLSDIINVISESVDVIEVLKPIYNFKAN